MPAETVKSAPAKQRSRKRRSKKERQEQQQREAEERLALFSSTPNGENTSKSAQPDGVEVEYVAQEVELTQPEFEVFADVFARFQKLSSVTDDEEEELPVTTKSTEDQSTEDKPAAATEADESDADDEDEQVLSKKKLKKLNRLTVAELKQLVTKPEVVEWVDATAADPKLLVNLKSYRNTVPVPIHWSQKRKYLQNKRGIEKPPFELPDFIKDTGIMEMRQAIADKEEQQTLKSKTRERVQPKMGKLEIDYQKLHDAFFRFQTRPRMTIHGDVYYEGKEFETHLKQKRPGELSDELIAALGIPPLAPPPWLINMQRYGPPPSYPSLKIPGLSAPIPEGAQWGYHPGGWGKPPVDEFNRPLYGDVFGVSRPVISQEHMAPVDRTLWGELESEEEEEEESEEEAEEEMSDGEEGAEQYEEEGEEAEEETGGIQEGLATPSGISSVATGLTTPDHIELRKEPRKSDEGPRELYKVLKEKESTIKGFMGSQHVYDLGGSAKGGKRKPTGAGVEVALDPSEVEGLDEDVIKARYEAEMGAKRANQEDLSDMVAEHATKQAKKRQKVSDTKSKDKKYKDFKF
ncbi:hypothetical protein BDF22DRAFT_678680 [Syncephalis plumigaleata]|nr:hypothetical protein BDF22DRAFT_678680 [Syncephalis plumigaleata]